jgi:xanthine/uracil permease
VISILIAPWSAACCASFPPVVTGTIIAVIGISLMRVGINWIFGNPFGPTPPTSSTRSTPNGWLMWAAWPRQRDGAAAVARRRRRSRLP